MQISSVVMSVGIGVAAGVAAAVILPKQPQFKKAVNNAADSIETAVEDAKNFVCGN